MSIDFNKRGLKHSINSGFSRLICLGIWVLALQVISPGTSWAVQVEDILPSLKVTQSNISTWSTPVAYRNGNVFIVAVEHPDLLSTGINLKTVIHKGQLKSGSWAWESFVVDSETIDDQWHNVPSLAVDAKGYIHLAYNMHNMPWQYAVSKRPLDINGFEFRGVSVTTMDKHALKYFKRSSFKSVGNAAIPGNQITYPAFFTDRNSDLYVTYRFAVRPKQEYKNRGFGAGIAKYNSETRTWISLGGDFPISDNDADFERSSKAVVKPFALSFGWWAYLPRLAFDSANRMHVVWMWRKGGAGGDHSNPGYAWSVDEGKTFKTTNGNEYQLPIDVNTADSINVFPKGTKFLGPTRLLIDPEDNPYLLFQPKGQVRKLVRLDKNKKQWLTPENMPSSALDFAFDTAGNLWAFATGLKIFKRSGTDGAWKLIHADKDAKAKTKSKIWCQPKVVVVPEQNMFLVHSQTCDFERVKVTTVKWD